MKRLVLIDGNALLHRAYHAIPAFSTSKGELVNAVYGFSSMVLKVLSDLQPDFVAVAWDEKGPTFRHQAFTQYKATRRPADDGLSAQYIRVHEVVRAFNIPEFSLAGYEADDLIGSLAKQAVEKEKNLDVVVVTGDRDIMQLIDDRIKVMMPKKTLQDVGLYGVDEFLERFGFSPRQLVDYKALAGDASDNIPGVSGIGDVTATKLVKQFSSIEELYRPEHLKTLPERMQKLLAEGAESAVTSKGLATIDVNAPIKLDLALCRTHDVDLSKIRALFEELEFKSLINRLPGDESAVSIKAEDHEVSFPALRGERGDDNGQNFRTADLDLAVTPVLEKMSKTGILVDLGFLENMGRDLKARLSGCEREIYLSIGHEFNINSPKQLSEILFDELHLPVVRKTKTGRSTDEETLRELYSAHPAIPKLLDYRQLFKLISTYVDALPRFADSEGRIHSTFNVEGAATGRLSSQNPNLQNIPIKGELGGELRKAFAAPGGKVLLGADYSQIELRILAHLSDDPNLKKAFSEGLDIHSLTASKIFKVHIEDVTKAQRSVGKTMNFATLYGQGPHALSRQLGVDFATAKLYIEEYFGQFPKVRDWMNSVLRDAYEKGYVETIWGRKRYFPELKADNRMLRAAGERGAINHPIQGTSADMIKKAMVDIGQSSTCSLILQVHDELLFECGGSASSPQVQKAAKMVKEKMENALALSVPVVVELRSGSNWGEMRQLLV